MNEIRMNFAVVSQAEADIDNMIKFKREKLDQMERAMRMVSASWDGEAQRAYEQRQRKINSIEQDLINTLTRIKKAVHEAKLRLMARDKAGAQSFGG